MKFSMFAALRRRFALGLTAAAVVMGIVPSAQAYLGSFNANDGYHLQSGTILGDVSIYNAGASGINAGGGGFVQTLPDVGLWKLTTPVGGYFTSAANRNAALLGGPPYNPNPATGAPAYIVGAHGMGRAPDGLCLALRNDTPLGTGPMKYNYSFDTYDFGGLVPASVTSGPVVTQFYYCPNPGDTPNPGTLVGDKFTMTFADSSGNVGLQWGYARDNSVYWRTSSSNPWTPTAFIADQFNWDGVKVSIDLTADTFGIDYFDISANAWSNMVPAGTALGMPMTNLTTLGWQLEDGLSAGVGGKNFFDDFSITAVPEPGTWGLMSLGVIAAGVIYRRRKVA